MKYPCKGTIFQAVAAGGVLAPVAQVISLDIDPAETETFEDRDLSQTGASITDNPTGYSTPGGVSGELWFDPALAPHMAFSDAISDPVLAVGETALMEGAIVFPTVIGATWPFESNGISFGLGFAMNEGIKAKFSMKFRTLMTYNTPA